MYYVHNMTLESGASVLNDYDQYALLDHLCILMSVMGQIIHVILMPTALTLAASLAHV